MSAARRDPAPTLHLPCTYPRPPGGDSQPASQPAREPPSRCAAAARRPLTARRVLPTSEAGPDAPPPVARPRRCPARPGALPLTSRPRPPATRPRLQALARYLPFPAKSSSRGSPPPQVRPAYPGAPPPSNAPPPPRKVGAAYPVPPRRRPRKPLLPPARPPSSGSQSLGKSRRRTAYPQQIVTTRLLYCLQDRFAQLSRLQRI